MANQVVDMEWSFGVTAANSEVAQVGNTFVHLKLMIDKGDGKVEPVPMGESFRCFHLYVHVRFPSVPTHCVVQTILYLVFQV